MDFPLSIKTYLESKTSQEPEAWKCISEMEVGGGGGGGWVGRGPIKVGELSIWLMCLE